MLRLTPICRAFSQCFQLQPMEVLGRTDYSTLPFTNAEVICMVVHHPDFTDGLSDIPPPRPALGQHNSVSGMEAMCPAVSICKKTLTFKDIENLCGGSVHHRKTSRSACPTSDRGCLTLVQHSRGTRRASFVGVTTESLGLKLVKVEVRGGSPMEWQSCRSIGLGRGDSVHDLLELRLERGATNQEAVDVGHRGELGSVLGVGRAAVLDADGIGHSRGNPLGNQIADTCVGRLSILWTGSETSADGPDGLVRNHHLLGVKHPVDQCELLVHLKQDGWEALFADALRLPNAIHARHARIKNVPQLILER
mmetsp:Transcript_10580/g.20415  ORF Transcript_10580/g.20415 Transcript_10580/m.20415 type:complete len:308 (+) Transcript_10580:491-1414(+)